MWLLLGQFFINIFKGFKARNLSKKISFFLRSEFIKFWLFKFVRGLNYVLKVKICQSCVFSVFKGQKLSYFCYLSLLEVKIVVYSVLMVQFL